MKPRVGRMQSNIGLQAIALAGSTGTAQIIMAVLYIFTARSSAPSEFGLVITAIALGTVAVGLLDFGTNSYWTREAAANRLNPTLLGKRLASKFLYSAAVLAVWTLITSTLFPASSLWMAGPVAMSIIFNQSCQVPLRALGRNDLVAIAILLDKTLAGAFFMILMALQTSPISALWLSLSIGGISSALMCWRLTPRLSRPRLALRRSTNPWSEASHYGIATVAMTAQSLDIPMLTLFGGTGATGTYGAVSRWTQPMGLFASAFSSASAPHIAKARSAREAWGSARKSIWLLGVAVGLSLLTAILAPFIVDTLIGPNYPGSADVLRILAAATILSIANQPLYVFLQARGFDKQIALITLASVSVQLTLVAILSGTMHAPGAAMAALCTQLVMLILLGSLLANNWGQLSSDGRITENESVVTE